MIVVIIISIEVLKGHSMVALDVPLLVKFPVLRRSGGRADPDRRFYIRSHSFPKPFLAHNSPTNRDPKLLIAEILTVNSGPRRLCLSAVVTVVALNLI